MSNKYYVYAYLDPRVVCEDSEFSHEPFYIGRGCGSRLTYHLQEATKLPETIPKEMYKRKRINMIKINKIRSILKANLQPIIIKLAESLTLDESKSIEKEYISTIGRSIFGEGTLTNLTEGGEGRVVLHSGRFNPFYGKNHTEDTKAKISQVHSGKVITDEHRSAISEKLRGKPKSRSTVESRRTYMRKLVNENPESPILQRLGESRSKEWFVEGPDGTVYKVLSLRKFCTDNELNHKTLLTAKNKGRRTTSGWNVIESVDDYTDLTKKDA